MQWVVLGAICAVSGMTGYAAPTPPTVAIFVDTYSDRLETNVVANIQPNDLYPRVFTYNRMFLTDDAVAWSKDYKRTVTTGPRYHQQTTTEEHVTSPPPSGLSTYTFTDTLYNTNWVTTTPITDTDVSPRMSQGVSLAYFPMADCSAHVEWIVNSSTSLKFTGGTANWAYRFRIYVRCYLDGITGPGADLLASNILVNGVQLISTGGYPYFEVTFIKQPNSPQLQYMDITPICPDIDFYSYQFMGIQYLGAGPLQ